MQVDDIIYSVYYDRIQSLAVRLANDLVEKDRYLTTTTLSYVTMTDSSSFLKPYSTKLPSPCRVVLI